MAGDRAQTSERTGGKQKAWSVEMVRLNSGPSEHQVCCLQQWCLCAREVPIPHVLFHAGNWKGITWQRAGGSSHCDPRSCGHHSHCQNAPQYTASFVRTKRSEHAKTLQPKSQCRLCPLFLQEGSKLQALEDVIQVLINYWCLPSAFYLLKGYQSSFCESSRQILFCYIHNLIHKYFTER